MSEAPPHGQNLRPDRTCVLGHGLSVLSLNKCLTSLFVTPGTYSDKKKKKLKLKCFKKDDLN